MCDITMFSADYMMRFIVKIFGQMYWIQPRLMVASYDLLVVPMLYTATDEFLHQLNEYVAKGGHVLYTFKSGLLK